MRTLKHIIIYILLAAVLCQSFNRVFIVIDYYSNTASFAKNCVNKARPMMHCNGKCQMMKKLQQEDKKDNKDPLRKAENRDVVIASKHFFPSLAIPTSIITTPQYINRNDMTLSRMPRSCFHPPSTGC